MFFPILNIDGCKEIIILKEMSQLFFFNPFLFSVPLNPNSLVIDFLRFIYFFLDPVMWA